jgi:hypothetical protein
MRNYYFFPLFDLYLWKKYRKDNLGQLDIQGAAIEDLEQRMLDEKKRGATVFRFQIEKEGNLTMYAETKPEKDAWVKKLTELASVNVNTLNMVKSGAAIVEAPFAVKGARLASSRSSLGDDDGMLWSFIVYFYTKIH